jgi:hypothetical protein
MTIADLNRRLDDKERIFYPKNGATNRAHLQHGRFCWFRWARHRDQASQPLESVTWPAWEGTVQRQAGSSGVDSSASVGPQENKTGLPDHLKAGIEHLSGLAMDDVRVHYNSAKPAQLQALAYAQGTEIHVGPGQERHLPHEAWHVVQQKQGRVKPTMHTKETAINDEMRLEKEADIMGGAVGSKKMGFEFETGWNNLVKYSYNTAQACSKSYMERYARETGSSHQFGQKDELPGIKSH